MLFSSTQWPRSASSVFNTGGRNRGRPRCSIRPWICFQSTHGIPFTTQQGRTASPIHHSHEEPNVDPDSLRNTLEAHRYANRASLIVKIAGKGSPRQPINVPSLIERSNATRESPVRGQGIWRPRLPLATNNEKKGGRGKKRALTPLLHTGGVFLPQWAPSPGLQYSEEYPWMKHMQPASSLQVERGLPAKEQLGREIDAFCLYSQATPQETEATQRALQDISTAIKEFDHTMEIDVVGSRGTGLDLPLSDIDLNISTTSTRFDKSSSQILLRALSRKLAKNGRKNGLLRSVMFRPHAKVQIVTGRHASTYLEFQVQSTVDAFLSMQQTSSFVNEFPTLRNLFFVLKQMLTMRGLNRGDEQGLSSYPLLVMIVAALKFSEGKLDRRDVGGHFLFFLDMYSDIDFTATAISFSPLQYIVKRHPQSPTLPHVRSAAPAPDSVSHQRDDLVLEAPDMDARRKFATIKPGAEWLMCLQDPANLQNDLGRGAVRIREIQSTFIRIRGKLKTVLKEWEDQGVNDQRIPLLASCIGGDYRIHEHMRYDMRGSVDATAEDP